jgi:hypothetical protein
VRRYRGPDGSTRVWFDPGEIDLLAEEELRRAGLLPPPDRPVVDVERLLEGHLGVDLDQYAPLPRDLLGVTEFRPGLPPYVGVNAALTQAAFDDPDPPPGARGRWRATLAHEAAHVLLHRALTEPDPSQTSLLETSPLEGPPANRLFRCLKREVVFGGGTDWREVQANRCMAALLMPRSLFVQAVARAKPHVGVLPSEPVPAGRAEDLARRLARLFDVSRQAARIRLVELGLVTAPGQESLYP